MLPPRSKTLALMLALGLILPPVFGGSALQAQGALVITGGDGGDGGFGFGGSGDNGGAGQVKLGSDDLDGSDSRVEVWAPDGAKGQGGAAGQGGSGDEVANGPNGGDGHGGGHGGDDSGGYGGSGGSGVGYGGGGGSGGDGGGGGGGSASFTHAGGLDYSSINISGGSGGSNLSASTNSITISLSGGGGGGNAFFLAESKVAVIGDLSVKGGDGGLLNGGGGGQAKFGARDQVVVTGDIRLSGGVGGGGVGGGGGGGGVVFEADGVVRAGGNINLGGGAGGDGGNVGGKVNFTAWEEVVVTGDISLSGGGGGDDTFYYSSGSSSISSDGDGGDGGQVVFSAAKDVTAGAIKVQSGSAGQDTNTYTEGRGGRADLTVGGSLKTSAIDLTQNDAVLSFKVNRLDVTAQNTTITLNETIAWDEAGQAGVKFGLIHLGGGHRLTIDDSQGSMSLNALQVTGPGNTYDGKLAVKELTFDLPASLVSGPALLQVTGQADLDNTTLGLGPAAYNPLTARAGQRLTLIETSAGLSNYSSSGDSYDANGNRYAFGSDSNNLYLTLAEARSFEEIVEARVGEKNVNTAAGAGYLDWLAKSGAAGSARADEIGQGFNAAIAPGGRIAHYSLQQFFGGYAAYADQALKLDGDSFNLVWKNQNQAFIDRFQFEDGLIGPGGRPVSAPGAGDWAGGGGRVWLQGFGSWADQDDRNGRPGYDYKSRGVALGYEFQRDNVQLGLAAAYSSGDLELDKLRYKNEADLLNLALYGAWRHDSGFYLSGGLGYGRAWNDYKVRSITVPGGVKKAEYESDRFSADLELGYVARLGGGINLIPSLGLEYSYLSHDGWTEKVNNSILMANRFRSGHDSGLNIPVGLRLNTLIETGESRLVPELRAAYVYAADKARPSVEGGFDGAPGSYRLQGVDPGRSHWRLGAGLSGQINQSLDLKLDYDFEGGSGLKSHQVAATIGFSF